jgi:hypothetical protein
VKEWLPIIATIAVFTIVEGLFGLAASLWLGTVVLAYCIGVFWGAGDQIRKQKERDRQGSEQDAE